MPAAIPDRFRLEVRLGRDGDIEEWLATDVSLDRPVLVRSLGPETSPERRSEFVTSVSGAAKGSHSHLARVFAVARVDGGAYSVSEWTGGATLADRVEAHQPIDLPDFLPNAAGLAGALAAMHTSGAVHGRINTSAISYSGAHAAKLGAFGRPISTGADGDVRALAAALETALTGSPPAGPPPSERVDGVPRAIDRILRSAQSGAMTAPQLETALRAAPTPRAPVPESGATSRRLIYIAIGLVIAAVGLVVVGFLLSGGRAPVVPTPTTQGAVSTTITAPAPTSTSPGSVSAAEAATFDPFGEGGENDQLVGNLLDGDLATVWRTERYLDPLPLLKPGVGLTFRVSGTPGRVELARLTPETTFEVRWSQDLADDLDDWEAVVSARAVPSTTVIAVPPRENGYWLIWLTDLPGQDDGTYLATMAQVRFLP